MFKVYLKYLYGDVIMVVEYKSVEFRGKVWVGYLGIYCIEMVFKVLEMYIVV